MVIVNLHDDPVNIYGGLVRVHNGFQSEIYMYRDETKIFYFCLYEKK